MTDIAQSFRMLGAFGKDRPESDFYPSPDIAIRSLLEYESFGKDAWEPAAGGGAISNVMKEFGLNVYESDLFDWGIGAVQQDFMTHEYRPVETIITNPPYHNGLSEKFIRRSLEMTKEKKGKCAFLQKLSFLAGQKRYPLFKNEPFKCCVVFSARLPRMHAHGWEGKKSSSMIDFAWYIWDHAYEGRPYTDWILVK